MSGSCCSLWTRPKVKRLAGGAALESVPVCYSLFDQAVPVKLVPRRRIAGTLLKEGQKCLCPVICADMNQAPDYIMDDPREGQRLLDKVDAPAWIAKYFNEHLQGAKSILSVGCGPAVFLREMAEIRPDAEFVGVDLSAERIQDGQARLRGLPNARVQIGDVQALPFESGSFDFVFCRFLMEYLPDKQLALREMLRICREGGKILLQDLDGQLVWHFPEDPELQQAIEQVVSRLASTGFDPFVGRKLFHLCFEAGLAEINVQIDPYHLYAGSIVEEQLQLWRTKLEIAKPQLKKALGGDEAAVKFSERFFAYLRRPDTLTYSCLFTVLGTKPPRTGH
jgi:SAM-dependent methyltransferase